MKRSSGLFVEASSFKYSLFRQLDWRLENVDSINLFTKLKQHQFPTTSLSMQCLCWVQMHSNSFGALYTQITSIQAVLILCKQIHVKSHLYRNFQVVLVEMKRSRVSNKHNGELQCTVAVIKALGVPQTLKC